MKVDRKPGMGAIVIVTDVSQSTQNLLELPLKAKVSTLPIGNNKVK
jgi:hypothetical protein